MDYKHYPIVPVSAPRQVRKDTWDPSPHVQRYRAFRDEVRIRGVKIPECGYHLIFMLPMPKSWPKMKRRMLDGQPHQAKPDKDNLEKALLDAVYEEDSHVWDGRVSKIWAEQGGIIVGRACDLPKDLRALFENTGF